MPYTFKISENNTVTKKFDGKPCKLHNKAHGFGIRKLSQKGTLRYNVQITIDVTPPVLIGEVLLDDHNNKYWCVTSVAEPPLSSRSTIKSCEAYIKQNPKNITQLMPYGSIALMAE